MADPFTWMAISMGTAAVGGAVSAAGTYQQYQAKAANAAYQAQVAANNKKTAEQNAEMETQSGEIKAVNQGMKTRATVAATKVGEAASGVDVNTGSFAKVRTAEAETGMLDALTIRSDAAKKAWAFETQASNFGAESGLLTSESKQAEEAAPIAATGSLLGTASTVSGQYYKYLQQA